MSAPAGLDMTALERFLAERFGPGPGLRAQSIGGGQSNPTFFVDYGGRRMVLRKQPPGPILRGAHAVDREFRVLRALAGTPVPVPDPLLYCADASVLGTPFYLMERVDGRVFHDNALPGCTAAERRALYRAMAETLAKLHAISPEQAGLSDFGRPGNYFERQLARWSRQWAESPTSDIPDLDRLSAWLQRNLPSDDGRIAVSHGDFRLGNLMFHPTEPRVVAVLDWELSTLGHPLADLGFCCIPWNTAPHEYAGIRGLDLALLGIPSQQEFVAHYFAHALPTSPLLPFHVAFSLFRFAVIFVGIADRVRQGNAVDGNAARFAPLAARLAGRGLEVAGLAD